jgi:arylsulfatase A-like enzyme
MARLDKLGGPESYNHYAVGWAHAMNTPYQWTKQVASHWGGTRNGTIVHWPKGIKVVALRPCSWMAKGWRG